MCVVYLPIYHGNQISFLGVGLFGFNSFFQSSNFHTQNQIRESSMILPPVFGLRSGSTEAWQFLMGFSITKTAILGPGAPLKNFLAPQNFHLEFERGVASSSSPIQRCLAKKGETDRLKWGSGLPKASIPWGFEGSTCFSWPFFFSGFGKSILGWDKPKSCALSGDSSVFSGLCNLPPKECFGSTF